MPMSTPPYDDTALKQEVADLKARVEGLEGLLREVISSSKKTLDEAAAKLMQPQGQTPSPAE